MQIKEKQLKELAEIKNEVDRLRDEIDTQIEWAKEIVEDAVNVARDRFYERSEGWQEGDAGQTEQNSIDEFESLGDRLTKDDLDDTLSALDELQDEH